VVIFRDVTRFHELDEMKNQFVSDVSHELRTPLTNLNLYLDLLHKVTDPEKTKRYLATLRRETQRLTELIEDLLTISRLEAGRMEFDIEPVDVNRIVAELAVDRMQMAAQQELTLTYSIQPELPLARADFRLITQVLSNLLTNALNYTPPKESIHVETGLQEWEGESWITICVKDTGLGIAPDEMEYLFTRFFRGSASQATNAPGTGLGLAISQEIIDRLDGRITVESQLHQGSTFTVWLKTGL
jgi:signal transduction histidine kinase